MMKKNGFTLAEVLITLAIIGVVATMTLPALMTNTGEQQAKTGLKKMVNTLTEAAQMHKTVSGFDFGEFNDNGATINNDATDDTQTMEALLRARVAIDYAKTGDGTNTYDSVSMEGADDNFTNAVYLRDNTVIWYNPEDTNDDSVYDTVENDNLVNGFIIAVDTNGVKGPNILSNCQGEANGAMEDDAAANETYEDIDETCNKENRVIKDQFLLRLRGTGVQPQGPAAYWAYNQ